MSLMMTWFFGIFYFAVQSRDNLLVRPHPFVWRMVHGQAVLYSMLLVAMATQDAEDVRSVVKWMQFDDLREELPDASKDYAADCRLFGRPTGRTTSRRSTSSRASPRRPPGGSTAPRPPRPSRSRP